MATIAMSGNDSVIVNNRVFADFGPGTYAELTFPNEIANVKTGKNGNAIYGLNETGRQAVFKLVLIRGSSDDKFLNNLLAQQQANFAGFPLLIGQYIKKVGDGQGNIANDTYITSGGIITKQVHAKSNAEGESDQSVVEYEFKFSNSPRVIA